MGEQYTVRIMEYFIFFPVCLTYLAVVLRCTKMEGEHDTNNMLVAVEYWPYFTIASQMCSSGVTVRYLIPTTCTER